jgi:transcriptional regulator with XRE-family HTH domain
MSQQPNFGTRLKQLREAAGLTGYALAKHSGVSAQAIFLIEQEGRDPHFSTACKLARALGVSVAVFDEGGDDPPKPAAKPKRKPKG